MSSTPRTPVFLPAAAAAPLASTPTGPIYSPSPSSSFVGRSLAQQQQQQQAQQIPASLHVTLAASGRSVDAEYLPSHTIAFLKENLAAFASLAAKDQVLLDQDGIEWDERRLIHEYVRLSSNSPLAQTQGGVRVFLYSKQVSSSKVFSPSTLIDPDAAFPLRLPSDVELSSQFPPRTFVASSAHVMTRTLPQFEQRFIVRCAHAASYFNSMQEIVKHTRRVREEQRNITLALDVALRNVHGHDTRMRRGVELFSSSFTSQSQGHRMILDSWAYDVERLKQVPIEGGMRSYLSSILDPALASQPRLTLHDLLLPSLPRLSSEQIKCQTDHLTLERKIEEMSTKVKKLSEVIQSLSVPQPAALNELDTFLINSESLIQQFQSYAQQYDNERRDASAYIENLDASLSKGMNASSVASTDSPSVASGKFQSILDIDESTQIWDKWRLTYDHMKFDCTEATKRAMSEVNQYYNEVRTHIESFSKQINGIEHILPLHQAASERLNLILKNLQSIHYLPESYAALLTELPRRREFRKLFQLEAQGMIERVASLVNDEVQRRQTFHTKFGVYLPKGHTAVYQNRAVWSGGFGALIAALQDRPQHTELSFNDFDAALPDVLTVKNVNLSEPPSGLLPPSIPTPTSSPSSAAPSPDPQLQLAYPWVADLVRAREKIATLENELVTLRSSKTVAASLSPIVSSKSRALGTSRRNSAESPKATTSSTSPPMTHIGEMNQLQKKYDQLQRTYEESQQNCASLEAKVHDFEQERKKHKEVIEALEESRRLQKELDAKLASVNAELKNKQVDLDSHSIASAKAVHQLAQSRKEVQDTQERLRQQRDSYEEQLMLQNKKLSIEHLAVGDIVLFYRPQIAETTTAASTLPASSSSSSVSSSGPSSSILAPLPPATPSSAASSSSSSIDSLLSLRVFMRDPSAHYYISPESASQYKQILRSRQERRDLEVAQQLKDEPSSQEQKEQVEAAAVSSSSGNTSSKTVVAALGAALSSAIHGPKDVAPAAASSSSSSSVPAVAASSIASSSSPLGLPFGELFGEVIALDRVVSRGSTAQYPLPAGSEYTLVTVIIPDDEEQQLEAGEMK